MINKEKCISCGTCVDTCPVGAIFFNKDGKAQINKQICIQCGACQSICPVEAIDLSQEGNK